MDVVRNMQALQEMTIRSRNSLRWVAVWLLVVASSLLIQLASISTGSDRKPEPTMVHYRDIPEKVQITGKLRQPLGQLVTVPGNGLRRSRRSLLYPYSWSIK